MTSTGNWIQSPVSGADINTVTDPHALFAWWNPGSPYALAPEEDMTPDQDAKLAAIAQIAQRIDFAIDNGGAFPFAERGELTDLIRANAAHVAALTSAVTALTAAVANIQTGGGSGAPTAFTGTVSLSAAPVTP